MSRTPNRSFVIGRIARATQARVLCACVVAGALAASTLAATPARAEPVKPGHLTAQLEKLDKDGGEVTGIGWKPTPRPAADLPAPQWPAAGTKINFAAAGAKRQSAAAAEMASSEISATVVDRAMLPERWRAGVVAKVTARSASTASIAMSYAKFQHAYGSDWASRLRLWRLPECALTTPDKQGCSAAPLPSRNDGATTTVTANLAVSAASPKQSASSVASASGSVAAASTLVALAAAPSGPSGDFTATPLSATSSWSAGGSTGSFTWSYPMRTVPSIGGKSPGVSLSYSSSSVDGRSSATNSQPSWVGEGFEYAPGFIERRYVSCSEDKAGDDNNAVLTGDLCWRSNNATLSLAGNSTELVFESGKGWHSRVEDGSKIVRLTGADNGDNDGEHWKVTTTDGTQYFFGRNNLPGESLETNSAWTVPVYGNHAGEPGHAEKFSDSRETQAWRWNLDYVIDTHGETTSFWYDKETNQYAAEATESKNVSYVRGGALARIDYGTWDRGAGDRSVNALAQVVFTPDNRCKADCGEHDGAHWPDTPWDQECKASATSCEDFSPTFWSTKRLAKVTTRFWDTTKTTPGWQNVDSYTLTHSFPSPGDGERGGLWLDSIVHAGHVGGTVQFPPVTFLPDPKRNRVGTATNTTNNWQRLSEIDTETGARIQIAYSEPDCTKDDKPSAPENNTRLCYPVISPNPYDPGGADITEWWHKYVVTHVSETDTQVSGGQQGPTKNTYYTYGGTPAWHYADDDGLSKQSRKTWDQFRGYESVSTQVGDANKTLTTTRYLRGMHGDRKAEAGGTKPVIVPASLGSETVYDEDQFAGMIREQVVYNGTTDKPVSKTVNVPWRSNPTASRTIHGDTVTARYTGIQTTYQGTALGINGSRGWRVTSSHSEFDDDYGVAKWVQDNGDTSKTGDEKCTTTSYNRNTDADPAETRNIVTLPKQVTITTLPCGTAPTSPDHLISDTRTFYDGASSTATVPIRGDLTRTDELKNWTAAAGTAWLTTSTATFDPFGRRLTAVDPIRGNTTTSGYTPPNSIATKRVDTLQRADTTLPAWTTTTEFQPAWAVPAKITDLNGRINEAVYDPLGRTWKAWEQGWPRAGHEEKPSITYTYFFDLARKQYPYVKTEALNVNGGTDVSYDIYDGLLRPRQTQKESAVDGVRVVTDNLYDPHGRVEMSFGAHFEPGAPSGALWAEPEWSVPTQTLNLYDRAGRTIVSMFRAGDGVTNILEKWRTTTTYEGDRTTVVPPKGGTPSTTVTDAQGRTVELRQYTTAAGTAGASEGTTYQYNPKDQLASVTDSGGNQWAYKYDIRGRQKEVTDPDKGKSWLTYNDAGDLTTITDARNEVLAYSYDDFGRKTGVYDDAITAATKRIEWKYDKLAGSAPIKGQLTEAIRYDNGNAYKWQARAINLRYQVTGEQWVIPAAETGLAGTYGYAHGFSDYTGAPTTLTYPEGGGQVTETVTTKYDTSSGLPIGLTTNLPKVGTYVTGQQYTAYSEPTITTLKIADGKFAEQSLSYDLNTRRVIQAKVKPETAPGAVSDRAYTYLDAGSPLSITDTPGVGQADRQCFGYDYLQRLTSAWTPKADIACTTPATTADLGGPAPYRLEWDIDKLGNRTKETSYTSAGETTRSYTVPTPGLNVVRPHAVTAMTTTAPGQNPGTGTTVTYGYDPTGNTETRPGNTTTQSLTWDAEGKAVKVVEGDQTTSSLYDADGTRLIRRDAGGSTLYLPGMEIRRAVSGNTATVTGTRYYSFNGAPIASRTTGPESLTWLFSDHQGTQQIAVNAYSQQVTIRRQQPYGDPRGPKTIWPNNKGFVGGDVDPTGLTHIGAREYDPLLGRFISVDPVQDLNDPQQWNAYSYSGNDPIGHSDPTGLRGDDAYYGNVGAGKKEGVESGGGGNTSGGNGNTSSDSGNGDTSGGSGTGSSNGNGNGNGGGRGGSGGGSTVGSVAGSALKGQINAIWDNTLGALQGLYQQGMASYHAGQAAGAAVKNGDMTLWDALKAEGKRQFWNPGMPGGAYLMLKGLWDEGKATVSADNADDAFYHANYLATTVAMMFLTRRGPKVAVPRGPRPALVEAVEGAAKSCRNSFTPTTLVLMANGITKAIGDITEGDVVLATDPVTGQTEDRVVTATHVHDDAEFTDLTVRTTPGATAVIKTTREHPFWDESQKSWRHAGDLESGAELLTPNGSRAEVLSVRSFQGRRFMYNLTVADIHTYYVFAGNTPVLVHNVGEGCVVGQTLGAGKNAREGVALVDGNIDAPGVRGMVNEAGDASGCHVCGTTNPGTRSGNWIPDHQPPTSMVGPGTPQTAYPHCLPCARQQGGIVGQINRGNYDFG